MRWLIEIWLLVLFLNLCMWDDGWVGAESIDEGTNYKGGSHVRKQSKKTRFQIPPTKPKSPSLPRNQATREPVPSEIENGEGSPISPPLLPDVDDENSSGSGGDFGMECPNRGCSLNPVPEACHKILLCVNGKKKVKSCHGSQIFDMDTYECQPPDFGSCWSEPRAAGELKKIKNPPSCQFHNRTPSEPITHTDEGEVVLQNPVVTDWGVWGEWKECSKGKYVTGLQFWKIVLMSKHGKDHVGLVGFHFLCQKIGPKTTTDDNEIFAIFPTNFNIPAKPSFDPSKICTGALIGLQLNSVNKLPEGKDQIATDNAKGICSCSDPLYQDFQKDESQRGARGDWTEQQNCGKGEAVCGFQAQMQDFKERMIGKYDNTGLNNLRLKCCKLENPVDKCSATERRMNIRQCNNSQGSEPQRCDFEAHIGIYYNPDLSELSSTVYSSVGFSVSSLRDTITQKIKETALSIGNTFEYDWNDEEANFIFRKETMSNRFLLVDPGRALELHQVVATCSHFLVRSNLFVGVYQDAGGDEERENLFYIDSLH